MWNSEIYYANRRFLRGKIVDKARYDRWKDQSQNANADDGDEMDTQIQTMSFHIEDDDEQMRDDVNTRDTNDKDGALLIVKIP